MIFGLGSPEQWNLISQISQIIFCYVSRYVRGMYVSCEVKQNKVNGNYRSYESDSTTRQNADNVSAIVLIK